MSWMPMVQRPLPVYEDFSSPRSDLVNLESLAEVSEAVLDDSETRPQSFRPVAQQPPLPALSISFLFFFADDPVPFFFQPSCVFPWSAVAPLLVFEMTLPSIPIEPFKSSPPPHLASPPQAGEGFWLAGCSLRSIPGRIWAQRVA